MFCGFVCSAWSECGCTTCRWLLWCRPRGCGESSYRSLSVCSILLWQTPSERTRGSMLAELLSVVASLSVVLCLCPCGSHGLCRADPLLSVAFWVLVFGVCQQGSLVSAYGVIADSSSECWCICCLGWSLLTGVL